MPSASDTAYPHLKANPSAKELDEIYTPTAHELDFAQRRTRQPVQLAGLLLLLKTFQRLGTLSAALKFRLRLSAMYFNVPVCLVCQSRWTCTMPAPPGTGTQRS
jgi:Domain of unknown function (DUF4158)